MMKQLLIALCLASSLVGNLFATESTLAGGYHSRNVRDPSVVDAANFAVQQINQGDLVQILAAQSQVVAGVNYMLVLEIVGADGLNHTFNAVVFVPLPVNNQPKQLISYQDLGTVNTQTQ